MEQTQAASSAVIVDPFNGQSPTLAEYQKYRESGEIPERYKPAEPAEPAPADPPKEDETEPEEAEIEPESEPEETQEQPHKGSAAEKRIKQLLAEKKELQRRLEAAKPAQTDSPTAQPQRPPQNYSEWEQAFDPAKWMEDYAKANPTASYEKANAAMFSYMLGAREHFRGIEERTAAEKQVLDAMIEDARERYEEFDEIKDSFLSHVIDNNGMPQIPVEVLSVINDSDVLADLLYTLGSDEGDLQKFVTMARNRPTQAIRYVARVESLIAEELAKPAAEQTRGSDGKFTAPEKRQTQAPKPPSAVSGKSSRGFDVNDESLSAEDWMRQRNKQLGIG